MTDLKALETKNYTNLPQNFSSYPMRANESIANTHWCNAGDELKGRQYWGNYFFSRPLKTSPHPFPNKKPKGTCNGIFRFKWSTVFTRLSQFTDWNWRGPKMMDCNSTK